MDWMILPLKRYADFGGRSRRMEYWMFRVFEFAVMMIGLMAIGIVGSAVGSEDAAGVVGGIGILLLVLFVLLTFIPGLAVTVRRLHDTGRSGWMMLISLVPLIGPIVLLVFLFSEGTRGPNEYGEDPKALRERAGDVFS